MKQNQRRHTIIVGPAGSGKSLRAHELARDHAEHSGIKAVSVVQIMDLYGIDRAAQSEPAVLIIDGVLATDARVWQFLAGRMIQIPADRDPLAEAIRIAAGDPLGRPVAVYRLQLIGQTRSHVVFETA